jgi:lysozyme family protein
MQNNFQNALQHVLKHEGGFANHPSDPGGMTNLGVTKAAWEQYIRRKASEADMRALTPEVVEPFYKKRYWDVCRCDELQSGLDYLIFDIAVNSGSGRAAKFLQSELGVFVDGVIGNGTMAAYQLRHGDTIQLINNIADQRQAFWESLKTYPVFGKGWTRRGNEVREAALAMV